MPLRLPEFGYRTTAPARGSTRRWTRSSSTSNASECHEAGGSGWQSPDAQDVVREANRELSRGRGLRQDLLHVCFIVVPAVAEQVRRGRGGRKYPGYDVIGGSLDDSLIGHGHRL